MKVITLRRAELVWEIRQNTWTKTDWDNFVSWLKSKVEDPTLPADSWYKIYWSETYSHIKDLTWEQVVEQVEKYQNGDPDYILWQEKMNGYTYSRCVFDVLQEQMREDNYNSDIYETDYADDYQEDFFVDESIDKENNLDN